MSITGSLTGSAYASGTLTGSLWSSWNDSLDGSANWSYAGSGSHSTTLSAAAGYLGTGSFSASGAVSGTGTYTESGSSLYIETHDYDYNLNASGTWELDGSSSAASYSGWTSSWASGSGATIVNGSSVIASVLPDVTTTSFSGSATPGAGQSEVPTWLYNNVQRGDRLQEQVPVLAEEGGSQQDLYQTAANGGSQEDPPVSYRTRPSIPKSRSPVPPSAKNQPLISSATKTLGGVLAKSQESVGKPQRKVQVPTQQKNIGESNQQAKQNALEQFKAAQSRGFQGDNVKWFTQDELGSSIILVIPSIYGGNQSVLFRTDKVDNPAFAEFLKQQSARFREKAGNSPDPLLDFLGYYRYGKLQKSYFDAVTTYGPPKKIDIPRELYFYSDLASAKSILAMRQAKEEHNPAQVFVDDIFPWIPLIKTANMILILKEKVNSGGKASVDEAVGIYLSFADDVLTVGPGVIWLGRRAGLLGRGRTTRFAAAEVLAGTRNDGFREAASKIQSNGFTFDVASHGNATELILFSSDGARRAVTAEEAARLIRNIPGYQDGTPIRLIACDTGKLADGFAHQLAQELRVPIQAPNRWVWFDKNGNNLRVNGVLRRGKQFIENEADPGSWIWFGNEFWAYIR